MKKPHVRLAIMAKCPPEVLRRVVDSARAHVDSACIVIAPRDFATLPSEGFGYCCLETRVHQVPWQGYAPTRTRLLELAEADPIVDWVLMIDADDVFLPGGKMPDLEQAARLNVDAFKIPIEHRGPGYRWRWMRAGHLMRARAGFKWEGTGGSHLHERMTVPYDRFVLAHDKLVIANVPEPLPRKEEDRATPPLSKRDWNAEAMALRGDRDGLPLDSRVAFYLAQSLKDAGRFREAFAAFAHRAHMIGGNDEETFWAKLWMGKLARYADRDPERFFLEAHDHFPSRAEPLMGLAEHLRSIGEYDEAQSCGERAFACPYPKAAQLWVDLRCYSEEALREAGIDPS